VRVVPDRAATRGAREHGDENLLTRCGCASYCLPPEWAGLRAEGSALRIFFQRRGLRGAKRHEASTNQW
jgi:hypothetical protein